MPLLRFPAELHYQPRSVNAWSPQQVKPSHRATSSQGIALKRESAADPTPDADKRRVLAAQEIQILSQNSCAALDKIHDGIEMPDLKPDDLAATPPIASGTIPLGPTYIAPVGARSNPTAFPTGRNPILWKSLCGYFPPTFVTAPEAHGNILSSLDKRAFSSEQFDTGHRFEYPFESLDSTASFTSSSQRLIPVQVCSSIEIKATKDPQVACLGSHDQNQASIYQDDFAKPRAQEEVDSDTKHVIKILERSVSFETNEPAQDSCLDAPVSELKKALPRPEVVQSSSENVSSMHMPCSGSGLQLASLPRRKAKTDINTTSSLNGCASILVSRLESLEDKGSESSTTDSHASPPKNEASADSVSAYIQPINPEVSPSCSVEIKQGMPIKEEDSSKDVPSGCGHDLAVSKTDATHPALSQHPNNNALHAYIHIQRSHEGQSASPSLNSDHKRRKVGRVGYIGLCALPLRLLLFLAPYRNPLLLLLGQIIDNRGTKIKTCGSIPGGDSNNSSFLPNLGLPYGSNHPGWGSGLEGDVRIWSGQGPGNQHVGSQGDWRVPDLPTIASWAALQGFGLVPLQNTSIHAPSAQPVYLPPLPPIPLPPNLPPFPVLPNHRLNIEPNGSLFSYSGLPHSVAIVQDVPATLNYGSFFPLNQLIGVEQASLSSVEQQAELGQPNKDFDNTQGTSYLSVGNTEDWDSLLNSVSDFPNGVAMESGPSILPGHAAADAGDNTRQQNITPGDVEHDTAGPSLSSVGGAAHITNQPVTNEQRPRTTPQSGPTRNNRRFHCLVHGCGRHFPRRHRLEEHESFVHLRERAYPCIFQGCSLRYSNPSNMKRHFKAKHGGHKTSDGNDSPNTLVT